MSLSQAKTPSVMISGEAALFLKERREDTMGSVQTHTHTQDDEKTGKLHFEIAFFFPNLASVI